MTGQEIIATVLRASCHRLIGRLGGDPEIKYLQSGSCVATASLAVNKPGARRDDGQAPDWFRVEVWGEQAQAFADQCRKGSRVDVVGRIKTNRWTAQQGEQRCDLIVTAEVWRTVEQPAAQAAPAQAPAVAPAAGAALAAAPAPAPAEDDIPF